MTEENLYTPNCIRTVTGRYVNVFDPKPEMFCIEDIAHALSMMPRFGGHLPNWYSVAQHSVRCCLRVDRVHKLTALMHDCSEAYLMDIPKPIKSQLIGYEEIEDNLMKVLSEVFGFVYPLPEIVKSVDKSMLEHEWEYLMLSGVKPGDNPSNSKMEFLDLYKKLAVRKNKEV